jgi:GR25 family glycosyltransferase involved in LPS biosynthesis
MKGLYINLDSRKDRKCHFEGLKTNYSFLSNIQRFTAIENKDGALGCCYSHIDSLTLAMKFNEPYVAIFENDFTIINNSYFLQFIDEFENIKDLDVWDVIVLTPRGNTVQDNTIPNFKRITNNQTTTGYIIKTAFIPVLIKNLEEAIEIMIRGENKDICAIDQFWKRLQKQYNFYYYKHIFGGQLVGWSNNENRYVDYNERFRNQHLF